MNNCKDCKFWGAEEGKTNVYVNENPNLKFCGAIGWDDYTPEDTPIAVTRAYEESCLFTRADFGCVLFEKKE